MKFYLLTFLNELLSLSVLHVLVLAVGVLAGLWGWYQWKYRRMLSLARSLPTSRPALPLIGHLHHMVNDVQGSTDQMLSFLSDRSGRTFCVWIGPIPLFILDNPQDIKKFVTGTKNLKKTWQYDMLKFFLGDGILAAPVPMWKRTRRRLNPIFHALNMNLFVTKLSEAAEHLVQDLSAHVDGDQFDVLPDLFAFSCKNVYNVLFNEDLKPNTEEFHQTLEIMKEIGEVFNLRLRLLWLWWDFSFRFLFRGFLRKADDTWNNVLSVPFLKAFGDKNKTAGKTDWDADNNNLPTKKTPTPKTLPDVFTKYLQKEPFFSDEYMRAETQTLMLAGIDTSALAVSSCLVFLGSHPHVQEKLYQEVSGVLEDQWTRPTLAQLESMPYLEQVVKETLRRTPVIPSVARNSEEDVEISDCTIPAGSNVVLNLAGMHMNPTIFPDPKRFDPDRFSPENVAQRDPFAFLPFSAGPRDCIGKYYLHLQMKITLSYLVRAFKIHSDMDIDKMKFVYKVAVFSVDGYSVKLTRRT